MFARDLESLPAADFELLLCCHGTRLASGRHGPAVHSDQRYEIVLSCRGASLRSQGRLRMRESRGDYFGTIPNLVLSLFSKFDHLAD
jgi:hypothetical protein